MIPLFKVRMAEEAIVKTTETLTSGFITQGPKVEEFEGALSNLFGTSNLVSLNSATSGLTLALRLVKDAYALPDSTEVLSSPLTCMATNEPILANNLRIKWIDIDPKTCNIDLNDLEKKITDTTRILLFVHWGGTPVDLDQLNAILDRKERELGFRVQVIEDCAHAMLATYKEKLIGTHGNMAVFSLQAIKHLTTGDGGILILPNEEYTEKAKLLRWFGIDRNKRNYNRKDFRLESNVSSWGYKFHMNDINASIGLGNLPLVESTVRAHRENGQYYNQHLSGLNGIILLDVPVDAQSAYWIYTLLVDEQEKFIEFMTQKGITVSSVHKRNDVHSCFREFKTHLPNLDSIEEKYMCIPVGWWLSEKERDYIVKCIQEFSSYSSSHF